MGSGFPMISPYRAFPTSDGTLVIAAGNDATFQRLCKALGIPEVATDPRFASNPTRVEHRDELFDLLAEVTRIHTSGDLWTLLRDHSVPGSPIQDMADVVRDEQVEASGMLPRVDPSRNSRLPGHRHADPLGRRSPRDHPDTPRSRRAYERDSFGVGLREMSRSQRWWQTGSCLKPTRVRFEARRESDVNQWTLGKVSCRHRGSRCANRGRLPGSARVR